MGNVVESKQLVLRQVYDFLRMAADAPEMMFGEFALVDDVGIIEYQDISRAKAMVFAFPRGVVPCFGVLQIVNNDEQYDVHLRARAARAGARFCDARSYKEALARLSKWGVISQRVML